MNVFSFQSGFKKQPVTPIDHALRALLFIFGAAFIVAVVVYGVEKVSGFLNPYLVPSAQALMAVFFFGIYPASFVKRIRRFLLLPTVLTATLLKATAWLYALLFVMSNLGFWGLLFCFLFNTLTPITLIGAVFKGAWGVVGNLLLWILVGFVIKIFAASFQVDAFTAGTQKTSRRQPKGTIIDIEANPKDDT